MGRDRIKIDLLIHDLKVPLAVIEAGITSLLQREEKYGRLTEKQKKVLIRALRNAKVTQRLVNDALELGRSREGVHQKIACTISELVHQALVEIFDLTDDKASEAIKGTQDLKTLKKILMEKGMGLSVDESLWRTQVELDAPKIIQILRNLLNNALKYRKHYVELKAKIENDRLYFSVKDDGEGIPQEYHEKIFQCYFQMDGEGTCPVRGHGLGLAGVMILVEDMGGKLSLQSDQGQGAEFSVEIPLH